MPSAPSTANRSLDFRYDTVTRQDGWAFLIGNPDFDADDSVYAVYGEVWLPLTDSRGGHRRVALRRLRVRRG